MKHQDRTRMVADLPGYPYPVHYATQLKRRVQCLAMIKLFGGASGGFRGRPLAWPAVRWIHIAMLPNGRRLGMRLGTKL